MSFGSWSPGRYRTSSRCQPAARWGSHTMSILVAYASRHGSTEGSPSGSPSGSASTALTLRCVPPRKSATRRGTTRSSSGAPPTCSTGSRTRPTFVRRNRALLARTADLAVQQRPDRHGHRRQAGPGRPRDDHPQGVPGASRRDPPTGRKGVLRGGGSHGQAGRPCRAVRRRSCPPPGTRSPRATSATGRRSTPGPTRSRTTWARHGSGPAMRQDGPRTAPEAPSRR